MLNEQTFDLVGIATPPVYHMPMVLRALERGAHVLCEKPFAMNTAEAQTMLDQAEVMGKLHMIGHELRFNPTRRKLKDLLNEGAIGTVRFVTVASTFPTRGATWPLARLMIGGQMRRWAAGGWGQTALIRLTYYGGGSGILALSTAIYAHWCQHGLARTTDNHSLPPLMISPSFKWKCSPAQWLTCS
jgi:hypothetical protein